jgi:PQQ-dependent dehydrogenase (methanol/ethanol family)
MTKSTTRKIMTLCLVLLLLLLTACAGNNNKKNATENANKSRNVNEDKQSEEQQPEGQKPNTGITRVTPKIKQFKDLPGKPAPAFSATELKAYPSINWLTNGGNLSNQRYAPLDKINTGNIASMKGKWVAHLGSGKEFKYSGESTPVVYNGVMFVISGADDVLALDATTGDTIWEYRPQINQELSSVCCGWTSRGVAVGEGKVFIGLLDARLVALNQKTGKVEWETVVAPVEKGYTITSAPLYYNGNIYTGISGGDFGTRGRVTAFDAETGNEIWRFNTIPGPGEKGHDTWPQDNKTWMLGGAPVWQTPAVDPELGLLYFSTGNPGPDLDGSSREGDNLYSASIVAVDVKTGEYRWHFQEVHHDIWDLDAPCPVVLFEENFGGKMRKAIGQAGKTGWLYLLDRTNGQPLLRIDEKPVPQEPRQKTAATQPVPTGDAFVPQTITKEDIKRDLPGFKGKYGGIFTPFWEEPVAIRPSPMGGANWPPMSFSPDTGYMYIQATNQYMTFTRSEEEFKEGDAYFGSVFAPVNNAQTRGTLTAIDVKTNKIAWQEQWDSNAYSGVLSTKGGLLFAGHNDGRLLAYDAKSGKRLWEFQTGVGVNAPPITYEINGVQYVSVYAAGNSLAGTKHGDSVWTFTLNGTLEPAKVEATPNKKPAPTTDNGK